METKASLIAMSHLNDFLIDNNKLHVNFVKYLILSLKGDLSKEINPDLYWNKFQKNYVIPMELNK